MRHLLYPCTILPCLLEDSSIWKTDIKNMESGKGRGNYASAYKLSRSSSNTKALRRERRSIEQKELRQEGLNKRRNLCDLSPLQEGDMTITQDKNYKDKTPQKPRVDERTRKGFDRLEQLKKWKQERDMKRKLEEAENRKKNPVFRVSKAVDHADKVLFKKSATKVHPVKPKPAPVNTKPVTNTAVVSQPKPVTHTKQSGQTNSRNTVKERTSKKVEKAPVTKPAASTRTLRSARQPVAVSEPTTRTTRQSVKTKVPESKFKASAVPKGAFDQRSDRAVSPAMNLDKVTRRGDTTRLPSDSFTQTSDFGFNVSSFVFRPLSPASAAGFLCPNQDSSCVSFLETNPKRSSTPKKSKGSRELPAETVVNTTVQNQTSINLTQDETKENTTAIENNEKKDVSSPEIQNKSVRRSRRSVAFVSTEEKDEIQPSENEIVEKPRRSTRNKSSASVYSEVDTNESVKEEKPSPVKRRRSMRTAAASVSTVSEKENADKENEKENVDKESGNENDKENSEELLTPKGRKSSRRSVASAKRTISDSGIDINKPSKENTPTNKKKLKSRNKSFGGFRLPDAESVVLSAKRNPRRKTLMPKSPEEWIEVLSNSPMVEMTRRKHKLGNTSLPTLNFDDVDLDESVSSMETENSELKVSGVQANRTQSVTMDDNEVFPAAMDVLNESNKENEPHPDVLAKTNDQPIVQVGEVSSTQDGPLSEDGSSDSEQDVPYFRQLLCTETNRLNGLSDHWNIINEDPDLSEDVHGQIRTTVGQAKLLMDQRFKQFSGLIDNCEFKLGEKETTCMDLKGFWEMIYYQVEDVDNKFEELKKMKENNWVDDKPKPVVKKVKKKVSKPAVSKPAVKSKFAAFRAQILKKNVSSPVVSKTEEEKVFEVPGFFTVASPVRSPKFHCDGGTPKKSTPPVNSVEKKSSKDGLHAPSSVELFPNRTPSRKSYVPAVPSPLLKDTTPLPRPTRTCTQKTPIPKRLIDEVDNDHQVIPSSDSKRVKRTPARRSLRTRKSVNFADEVNVGIVSSPSVEGSDDDFARLLQPLTNKPEDDKAGDVLNDSLSKYLQPLSTLEKEDTPKQIRGRRASLKGCRSTERRRSRQRSVHFVSPTVEEVHHVTLPHTPYNKDSLVKQKRVTRRSMQNDDVYSIENIDNDENVPPPSFRSPRPSLLGTPPDLKNRNTSHVSNNVPTATLISFTP